LIVGACAFAPRVASAAVLDEIRRRGAVRVASTFDYRPFAYREGANARGIDVDFARDLARALAVELTWIETTWLRLLDDLRRNTFDVAMCGISVTPERAAAGLFARPYFHTGKTVLARCRDVDLYRTLADVDRAGVKVIVNPGGTNEAWARAHLAHAELIVNRDNLSIFDVLERGGADLMITDAIEADAETARRTALCTNASAPYLERFDKAWLLPNDPQWQRWLDDWLARLEANGTAAATTARAIAEARGSQ
jgi:cyclohexadienyl dehydratase